VTPLVGRNQHSPLRETRLASTAWPGFSQRKPRLGTGVQAQEKETPTDADDKNDPIEVVLAALPLIPLSAFRLGCRGDDVRHVCLSVKL
jgi:hypothetical protein